MRGLEKGKRSKRIKVGLTLFVIAASVVYCLHTLWRFRRGVPPSKGSPSVQSPFRREDTVSGATDEGALPGPLEPRSSLKPFPQENLRQVVRQLAKDLQLSAGQKIQLAKVWLGGPPQSPEELQQRLNQTREHLTPQQKETLQSFLDARVSQRVLERREIARKALPPDQFRIYEKGLGEVEEYFIELLNE